MIGTMQKAVHLRYMALCFRFQKLTFPVQIIYLQLLLFQKLTKKNGSIEKQWKKQLFTDFPLIFKKLYYRLCLSLNTKGFFFFFFYLGLIWNSLIPLYFRFFWLIVASLSTNSSPSSFDASSLSSLKNYFSSLIAVHFVVFLLILPAEGCMFSGNSVWKNLWN